MQPRVTIITPVHNGARYLRECIDSVLAQTYTNWEYILFENCSSDDTYEIAKSYTERDSRIRVVKFDDLLPLLKNHNRAFALLPESSKYCKPLMADDWLYPECLERMVAAAEAHPSVGVVGCYAFDSVFPNHYGYPYPAACVPGLEAVRVAMLGIGETVIVGTPTAMLIRSDLIRKRRPFYDEVNVHADHETCLDILTESDYSFIHQILCINRLHKESQSELHMWTLETLPAHEAHLLHKYGPLCLNDEEMQLREKKVMSRYYRALAQNWFRYRGNKFWNYHRHNFRRMNLSLEYRGPFGRAIFRHFLYLLATEPFALARAAVRGVFGGARVEA